VTTENHLKCLVMMLIVDNDTLNFVTPMLVCTYVLEIMTEKWSDHYLHAILD
jgi:hypothetical protein